MSDQNAIVYVKRDADEGTPVSSPPMLWMLIEYRTRNKVSNYEVVAAKDVCNGGGGRANSGFESMHTGKLIYVKKDGGLVQATIVTISDDKTFLNNELKDLMELQKEEYEVHSNKKRKRVSMPKSDRESVATSSAPQYVRWNNSHESNSSQQNGAMNKQSVIKSNPNVQNYPPMTFDQQTQTDFKAGTDLTGTEMRFTKILATEEDILRDVHSMSEENHDIKQQVADLRVEVAEIKTLLLGISEKLTQQNDGVHSTSTDFNRSTSILNSTQTPSSVIGRAQHDSSRKPRILNLSHQSNYTPHTLNYNSISIEPVIDASMDSNFSYSDHSRMSLSASNQSIYQADTNHIDSPAIKLEYNCISKNADDEGDPNEEIVLGSNNTTVPRSVLMSINWNSHTSATRHLLRAKFSREVLATHSLTGKPSPGM